MGAGRGTHGNSWLCVTSGCREKSLLPTGVSVLWDQGSHTQLGQVLP